MEAEPFYFVTPGNIQVIGVSGVGKTYFVLRLLDNIQRLFKPVPEHVFWLSTTDIDLPPWIGRLKDLSDIEQIPQKSLLVLDDLGDEFAHNKKAARELERLAIKKCHHNRLTVITLLQNAFAQNRTSRINATALVLFRSHSDQVQLRTLGSQIFRKEKDILSKALAVASRLGERYIVLSLHPAQETLRLVSRIFEGDLIEFKED